MCAAIVELGRLSRGYCELAYRSEPLGADIILALADMGINYEGIHVSGCGGRGRGGGWERVGERIAR